MPRKTVTKKMRFEVFKRDEFTCQYCGAHPPKAILHVDHIHPVAQGGGNESDNLITACESCNQGKGANTLKNAPASLKEKAEKIKEQEAQILGYAEVFKRKQQRIDAQARDVCGILFGPTWEIKNADFASIKNFVDRLGYPEVHEAAEIAASKSIYSNNRLFRYFCGVCWGKVRGATDGQ